MGLVTGLLSLPLAPVRGVVWLAEVIRDQAERELSDRESVSVRLVAVRRAYDAGEISDRELAYAEEQILEQLRWNGR